MLLYFSSEIFNKKGINNILLRGLEQWKNKNKLLIYYGETSNIMGFIKLD